MGLCKGANVLTKLTNLQELRQRIKEVCATITLEILTNVRGEFENRVYDFQEVGGSHYKHLMK